MANSKVEKYISDLIIREAGYVNNVHDSGGATRWGITEAVARKHNYSGAMCELPKDVARKIYIKEYWTDCRFADVENLSQSIAEELFDTGVNMGQGIATMFLQRALNVFNQSHRDTPLYPEIKVDGGLGAKTLAALDSFLKLRGQKGERVMLRSLNCQQGVRYMELAEKREVNEEFVFGWFDNRIAVAGD